ncbi:MAG: cell division protein ZipA C-terminal FtsZ-binding domain-containing protein [Pseudomonadota bacterium]|nr:cell division protein ZipA C-terminal FtsZ-binding domain-containing protein [Pseudomonadota bacterium]
MNSNYEIYIVGSAVLFFLIIVFFYIRKISNSQELKVKIESLQDPLESSNLIYEDNSNVSIDNDTQTEQDQELVIFNLISSDKSFFNIPHLFGFLSNCGAKLNNGFFSFYDEKNNEKFRIINALKPGTFDNETETFAIVLVSDLAKVEHPLLAVKSMIDIAAIFSENFHSSMCNQDRTPITKQMISHIESKAQEIERIRKLHVNSLDKE